MSPVTLSGEHILLRPTLWAPPNWHIRLVSETEPLEKWTLVSHRCSFSLIALSKRKTWHQNQLAVMRFITEAHKCYLSHLNLHFPPQRSIHCNFDWVRGFCCSRTTAAGPMWTPGPFFMLSGVLHPMARFSTRTDPRFIDETQPSVVT